jgi:hypothetical protein
MVMRGRCSRAVGLVTMRMVCRHEKEVQEVSLGTQLSPFTLTLHTCCAPPASPAVWLRAAAAVYYTALPPDMCLVRGTSPAMHSRQHVTHSAQCNHNGCIGRSLEHLGHNQVAAASIVAGNRPH